MFSLEPPLKRPRLEQHYSSHSQSQCFDGTQPPSTQPTAELQQETGTRAATELDGDAQERQLHAPNPDQTYTSPRPQIQTPAPAPEPLTGPSPSTASLNGSWYQDGFSQDPGFLASQEELRAILFTLANSAAPTRASSPELGKTSTTTSSVVYQYQQPQYSRDQRRSGRDVIPQSPLSSRRRIEYLKNYVAEIAPCLDMFDSHCTFAQQIPTLSHSFPALLYAILAISARQMERKSGSGTQDWYDSLELYQEAIRLLSPLLQVRDPKIVAACVLLCCLEMMSARAQDWHRHLEG